MMTYQRLLFLWIALFLGGIPEWSRANETPAHPEQNSGLTKRQGKVLLFGIDGATWQVMRPLIAEGKLPHFERLVKSGTSASLKTLKPTISPPIWTTIATGVLPDIHGILDFIVKNPNPSETTLVSSNLRRVNAVWNILSQVGYRVGVVNWWASFPAEPVNGFVISDRANYARKSTYRTVFGLTAPNMVNRTGTETYPVGLYEDILGFVERGTSLDPALISQIVNLPPALVKELQAQENFSHRNRLSVLKFALLQDESAVSSGLYALNKYHPDFLAFYFSGLDSIEHHFWKYMEPGKFSEPPPQDDITLFGSVIKNYYRYVDTALGKFLAAYGQEEVTVIVVSDHGHEADPAHSSKAVGYAAFGSGGHTKSPDGILILAGPRIASGAELGTPAVTDITPTLLALMGLPVAHDMPGQALTAAFTPTFLATQPLKTIDTYTPERVDQGGPVTSDMDETLKEKLRSLGYIN